MSNPELTQYLERAQTLLADAQGDRVAYAEIENYVLANVSRLAAEPDYLRLKETVSAIAARFGYPDPASAQEHFGLNSCAQ